MERVSRILGGFNMLTQGFLVSLTVVDPYAPLICSLSEIVEWSLREVSEKLSTVCPTWFCLERFHVVVSKSSYFHSKIWGDEFSLTGIFVWNCWNHHRRDVKTKVERQDILSKKLLKSPHKSSQVASHMCCGRGWRNLIFVEAFNKKVTAPHPKRNLQSASLIVGWCVSFDVLKLVGTKKMPDT